MSASSRSTVSTRSRITKQPPTQPTAINAGARETLDPSIPTRVLEDPNIAAAISALIFPQSHNLFESSPHRPQESSSQRSRTGKRKNNSISSTSRPAIRRKPVSDREVSELLRNDGFQAQNRSPSAARSTTAQSDDLGGSSRSRSSNIRSASSVRQTRSSSSRTRDNKGDQYAGEWGQAIPMQPSSSTSRHHIQNESMHSFVEEDDEYETPRASVDSTASPRRSKFIEGTMNDRSMGVASSWYSKIEKDGTTGGLSASPSKGATLQQHFRDVNKPLPAVPSPKSSKRRDIFRFGGHKEDENGEESAARTKGLRGSRSIFNFRLFNADAKESKNDVADVGNVATPKAPKAAKISKKKASSELDAETNLLNERKRKAEEAYAEQFGFKKRSKHHAEDTANKPPLTLSTANATIAATPLTAFRLRKDRLATPSPGTEPKLKSASSSRVLRPGPSQLRKRPSRKDLEAENAELRALLARERKRNLSVAINGDPLKDHIVIKTSEDGEATNFSSLENIPPVPRLPGKGTLQVLEGNHSGSRPKLEDMFGNLDNEIAVESTGDKTVRVKQSFEWPEDVF